MAMAVPRASENMSLEELLKEQMAVVQRALEFNMEITRRLADQSRKDSKPSSSGPGPIASALIPFTGQAASGRDGTACSRLNEPLLPKGNGEEATTGLSRAPGPGGGGASGGGGRNDATKRGETEGRLSLKLEEGQRQPIFPSADDVKQRVKAMLEKEYNVEDLYSKTGIWQEVARNHLFKNAALAIIAMNSIWLAIDTDYNKAAILSDAPPIFQVVENLFCTAFTIEIFVRFMAFRHKRDALTDGWFVFDATLVALMIWETWIQVAIYAITGGAGGHSAKTSIFRIFRLFRLTRVARLARLLRNMPELMILIKAMAMAIRSVFATLCLLLIVIYVFAILFTQLTEGSSARNGCFETVPQAMNCLLLQGVFTEEREFIERMLDVSWVYYVFVLIYLLIGSMTVLNMLIGVLCEVVAVTAACEKEELFLKDLWNKMSAYMGDGNPAHEMKDPHGHSDLLIPQSSFNRVLQSDEALQELHEVGIDVVALADFSDFIFRDRSELKLSSLIETVLQFRGSNHATVKHIVDTRTFLLRELSRIETLAKKAVKSQ